VKEREKTTRPLRFYLLGTVFRFSSRGTWSCPSRTSFLETRVSEGGQFLKGGQVRVSELQEYWGSLQGWPWARPKLKS